MKRLLAMLRHTLIYCLLMSTMVVAGDISRIGGPPRLKGVKYKILVLEYDSPQALDWGRDISQMIAQQVLGTIEGVVSVGVINLRQPDERIALSTRRIFEEAKTQNALVVIWGEFYTDSVDVYLHSHLRIIPREDFPASAYGLNLPYRFSADTMRASLPTLQVNFAPVKMPVATLQKLRNFYRQTVVLRGRPNPDAAGIAELGMGDTYYLLEKSGNWAKIQIRGGRRGWIRHSVLEAQDKLESLLGLVNLSQGIIQYIAGNYRLSEQSLMRYIETFAYRQDSMNRAFAHILLGNARFWGREYFSFVPKDEKSSIEYYRAAQLLPDHPSPINHMAIVNCYKLLFNPDKDILPWVEKRLLNIVKTQNDAESLNNLKVAYQFGLQYSHLWGKNVARKVFEEKISKVSELEARLKSRRE